MENNFIFDPISRYFSRFKHKLASFLTISLQTRLNRISTKCFPFELRKNLKQLGDFMLKTRKMFAIVFNICFCFFCALLVSVFLVYSINSFHFNHVFILSFCILSKCILFEEYLDICTGKRQILSKSRLHCCVFACIQ